MPDYLSPKAEEVLREIIAHKNDNGLYDADYWAKRFDQYSLEEDEIARSCFGELSDNDLVYVQWADDHPYNISVASKGISYFDEKKRYESEKKKEKRSDYLHDLVIAIIGVILGIVGTKLFLQ